MIGAALAWVFFAGMLGLGVFAVAFPGAGSWLYGVPQAEARGFAWVRAAGARDLGLDAALGAALWGGQPGTAGVVAIATGLVAVSDIANVLALRGTSAPGALLVHASGIGMGLIAGWLLIAGI